MESLDLHIYIFSFIFATFLNHKVGEYMTKNNKTLRMKSGEKFNDVMCLCCFSFFSLQNPYSFPFFGRGGVVLVYLQ